MFEYFFECFFVDDVAGVCGFFFVFHGFVSPRDVWAFVFSYDFVECEAYACVVEAVLAIPFFVIEDDAASAFFFFCADAA